MCERFLIVRVYFLPLGMGYPYCRVLLCLARTQCWRSGFRPTNGVGWVPSSMPVSSFNAILPLCSICRVYRVGREHCRARVLLWGISMHRVTVVRFLLQPWIWIVDQTFPNYSSHLLLFFDHLLGFFFHW